jgi:hypothetical protein
MEIPAPSPAPPLLARRPNSLWFTFCFTAWKKKARRPPDLAIARRCSVRPAPKTSPN